MITLTIPNDDSTALYHLGKSLIDMSASISGMSEFVVITRDEYETLVTTEVTCKLSIDSADVSAEVDKIIAQRANVQVDTTTQQVESFAADGLIVSVASAPHDVDPDTIPTEQFTEVTGFAPTTDSTGTPWDERIHSASKALNADGTWRLRRKPKDMDEAEWAALIESVKGELHTQTPVMADKEVNALESVEIGEPSVILGKDGDISINTGVASVSFDPAHDGGDETVEFTVEPPVTPPGDDFHTDAGVVTEQTVAGIPPLPVPPPVVVAPPVTEWDFPRLMTFLTERHGKIDVATVNTLLAQDGMSSVQELNAHPDKIGPFVARVKAHLGE